MTVFTFLLQTVTPAVLPASDAAGYEYYDVLGLEKYANTEAVRKAYKAKSLQLHPDKIAQRGDNSNAATAAAEYEHVQEAYAVLSDSAKREQYHDWKCSVARYKFIETNHGLSNPVALHENLQSASCTDKSRLLVLSTISIVLVLLQPILIAAKVNGITSPNGLSSASWVVILIPFWIFAGLYVGFLLAMTGLVIVKSRQDETKSGEHSNKKIVAAMVLSSVEAILILVGCIMLAKQWDRAAADKISWHIVSIPFYLAVLVRILGHLLQLRQIRNLQDSMVSTAHLEQKYGSDVEELSDEILSQHVVVTTDTSAVAAVLQVLRSSDPDGSITDEDVEAVRVQTSPEFRAAEQAARQFQLAIGRCVLLYITMIALIAAKLQGQITASWWTVFVPVWVALGLLFCKNFVVCLCVAPPLHDDDDDDDDEDVIEINIGTKNEDDSDGKKDSNKETTTAAQTVTDSINLFASAEGNMDDFNEHKNEDIMAEPALLARNDSDDDELEKKAPDYNGDNDEPDAASDEDAPGVNIDGDIEKGNKKKLDGTENHVDKTPQKESDIEKDAAEKGNETVKPQTDQDDDQSNHDKEEEETFRKWQERMHADESDFMETKFKALTGCCCYCFEIIILCLIVGKLEQDYGTADGDAPGDGGYNAFWVLFPVFLIAGILLLCCSICIYGGDKEKDFDEVVVNETEKPDVEEAQAPAIIPAAAGAAAPETTEHSSHSTTAAVAETTEIPDVAAAPTDEQKTDSEDGIDMDDLD